MEIQNNILRHYLKNCYFINGTAYAGKSTMCKMLAENLDTILSVVTQEQQPNLNYFNLKFNWEQYVSRDKTIRKQQNNC